VDAEPALQSVWLGFDLATPEPTAAVPSGFSIQAADSKAVDLVAKPAADELVIQLPYAQVWWSRPGLGVWAGRFGDGGEGDLETGVDGVIGVDLGSLVALGSSGTAPAKAQAGDWVVVIDPGSLALYTAQVVATSPGNSGQEALTLAPVQLGEVTP
nr:hypothetical protein [Thermoanaerobaculia bacterium]